MPRRAKPVTRAAGCAEAIQRWTVRSGDGLRISVLACFSFAVVDVIAKGTLDPIRTFESSGLPSLFESVD